MIKRATDEIFSEVVRHYRYMHQHPELSYNEKNTSEYITRFLDAEGISYRKNIGGYGILAIVKGEAFDSDRVIALCADLDALPIEEENDVPYRSINKKVMHACGHDAQAASLMGAVKLINKHRNDFSGTVLFIFQPAEEQSPSGAYQMLKTDKIIIYGRKHCTCIFRVSSTNKLADRKYINRVFPLLFRFSLTWLSTGSDLWMQQMPGTVQWRSELWLT